MFKRWQRLTTAPFATWKRRAVRKSVADIPDHCLGRAADVPFAYTAPWCPWRVGGNCHTRAYTDERQFDGSSHDVKHENRTKSHVHSRAFKAGDFVILRDTLRPDTNPTIHGPLKDSGVDKLRNGFKIHDDEIIGSFPYRVVPGFKGNRPSWRYRVETPTLDDYIGKRDRKVTPIYAPDASVIINCFDVHVSSSAAGEAESKPRYEILDAGTGCGSMALHLSRAYHAANPPRHDDDDLSKWKASRQAIIHSVEVRPEFSSAAQDFVGGFRDGIYLNNIDFHIGDVRDWINDQYDARASREPFLSNVFLDIPSVETRLQTASTALIADGRLIVFTTQITQILLCIQRVEELQLDLVLERVVELGNNAASAGREWSVKGSFRGQEAPVHNGEVDAGSDGIVDDGTELPHKEEVPENAADTGIPRDCTSENDDLGSSGMTNTATKTRNQSFEIGICRPKVGGLITGGGFLCIFRKI